MFFIAGVQQKKISLDDQPRMCGSCGLFQARLYRVDHYISIFFLPIIRVKKGIPVIGCERCGFISSEMGGDRAEILRNTPINYCRNCGKSLEPGFKFCPFCGRRI
jgi:hypothetical protein